MQLSDTRLRLLLSPSDVPAFLAREHLTTLSLAHTRVEVERPEVVIKQAELIFRKGSSTRPPTSRASAPQVRPSSSSPAHTATPTPPPAQPPP